MPISKINQDGSVQIYNKNTGQVLDVKPEDLPKYNPALVADYQSLQTKQQGVKNAAAAVQTGKLKLSDIPAEQKLAVVNEITASGGEIPVPKSANDIKKEQAAGKIKNLIGTLETRYQKASGGEVTTPIVNRILGVGKDIGASLGFDPEAETFNREKQGFIATLKGLTGDTGVLTEQDAQRLINLIPGFGASPQEAKNLFNDLRSQASSELGGNGGKTTINPKEKNALQALLPETSKFAEKYFQDQTSLPLDKRASQINAYTQNLTNPVALVANTLVGQKEAKDLSGPATELATYATAAEGLGGLPGVVKKIAGKILPGTGAATAREAAAKGIQVNTSPIIQAGDKYVADINPAAKKAWETLKPAIKDNTDLPELLTKLSDWGNKAYTKSGDVRAITEGQLKNFLYQAGRDVIQKEAPQVAELTTQMAANIARKKTLGKAGAIAGGAAVSGLTGAGLYALLNRIGVQQR